MQYLNGFIQCTMIRNVYRKILKFDKSMKRAKISVNDRMLKFKNDVIGFKDSFNKYDQVYRMERYPNISFIKIGAGALAITVVGSFVSYWIFRSHVHDHISIEGAKIAKNIAESEDLKNGLKTILEDSELLSSVSNLSANVVQKIIDDPTTRTKLLALLGDMVSDPIIQNLLVTLAVNFISREEIQNKLSEVIVDLLGRQEVKDKLNKLIDDACTNQENREIIADMIKDILSKKETSDGLHSLVNSFLFGTGKEKTKKDDPK